MYIDPCVRIRTSDRNEFLFIFFFFGYLRNAKKKFIDLGLTMRKVKRPVLLRFIGFSYLVFI